MNFINEMYGGVIDNDIAIKRIDSLFPEDFCKKIREAIAKWNGELDWRESLRHILEEYGVEQLPEVEEGLTRDEKFYIKTIAVPLPVDTKTRYRTFANPVVRYLSTFNLFEIFLGDKSPLSEDPILQNIALAYYVFGYERIELEDGIDYFISDNFIPIKNLYILASESVNTDIDNMKFTMLGLIEILQKYNSTRKNPLQGTLSIVNLFLYLIDTPFYKEMRVNLCQPNKQQAWAYYRDLFTDPERGNCMFDILGRKTGATEIMRINDLNERGSTLIDKSADFDRIVTLDGHGRLIWRLVKGDFTKILIVADVDMQNNLWHHITLPSGVVFDGDVRSIVDDDLTFYYLNFSGLGGGNEHLSHIRFMENKLNRLLISFAQENKSKGGINHLLFAIYLNREYGFNLLTNRKGFYTMGRIEEIKHNHLLEDKAAFFKINIDDELQKYQRKIGLVPAEEMKYLKYKLKFLILKKIMNSMK